MYSNLKIDGRAISFDITGTGCDTPQVYIGYPAAKTDPKVPKKVLRSFQKTCSGAADTGATAVTISYTLTDRDVSNWDLGKKAYTITRGQLFTQCNQPTAPSIPSAPSGICLEIRTGGTL